jgi:hypothetical protein
MHTQRITVRKGAKYLFASFSHAVAIGLQQGFYGVRFMCHVAILSNIATNLQK